MAKRKSNPDAESDPSLEEAMAELGRIVSSLESGQTSLDDSLAQFERGMRLLRVCHRKLDAAAQRIEIVTHLSPDGPIETEEFDATSTLQKSKAPVDAAAAAPLRESHRNRSEEDSDGGVLF
ncbi:MAG: exodeoxyribonuclease VII small subunit [Planctomycetota bacterium]